MEDILPSTDDQLAACMKYVEEMMSALDNQENWCRQDAAILTNLLEVVDGRQPVDYFEVFFHNSLDLPREIIT